MSTDPDTVVAGPATPDAATDQRAGASPVRRLLVFGAIVVVINVLALIFLPPFDPHDPAAECAYPVCFINGTLEFPPPHVVIGPTPESSGGLTVTFEPSITNTILTMWIVAILVAVVLIVAARPQRRIPGRLQNAVEYVWEALGNFGEGIAGAEARRFTPLFVGLFLLILFMNWSGLIPPVGRIETLRAPTSDINITIGMALVSFALFWIWGFRSNGIGYLSKFFPLGEFRNGIGAGILALFVGLVELLLEFVKPVTLSMRLFGNIYGGEVALGVLTALTLVIVPVALLSLEFLLNFIQALIFSVLTLVFIVIAMEHHSEAHEAAEAEQEFEVEEHQAAPKGAAPAH